MLVELLKILKEADFVINDYKLNNNAIPSQNVLMKFVEQDLSVINDKLTNHFSNPKYRST